jgi:starch synthase (maltosyl-transferring)
MPALKGNPHGISSVYYLHPLLAGPVGGWNGHLERVKSMEFTHVCVGPIFAPGTDIFLVDDYEKSNRDIDGSDADATVRRIADQCAASGLGLLLDLVLDRVAAEGAMARSAPHWFYRSAGPDIVDPRQAQLSPDALPARFDDPLREQELTAWWTDRIVRLADAGAVGFRLLGIADVPTPFVKALIDAVRRERGSCLFTGWTPGLPWPLLPRLEQAGFDAVFASTPWWDGRASWFIEEHNALRRVAPQIIGLAEAPFEERLAVRSSANSEALRAAYLRSLRLAATSGQGLLVPMGFEFGSRLRMDQRRATADDFEQDRTNAPFDLMKDIVAANRLARQLNAETAGEMRSLTGPGEAVSAVLQVNTADVRTADRGIVVAINHDAKPQPFPILDALPPSAGAPLGNLKTLQGDQGDTPLAAGEVRVLAVTRTKPVADRARRNGRLLVDAIKAPRIAIERVTPSVDGGAFPIKRVVGQTVAVEADVFTDGHDILAAELLWKAADDKDWKHVPLEALGNDRWRAAFTPTRVGRHSFTVAAWRDDYASLCHEIEVKHQAGADVALELAEARDFLERIYAKSVPCNTTALSNAIETLEGHDADAALQAYASPSIAKAIAASGERPFRVQHSPLTLEVERPQAEFASWYELFPRSQSGDAARHGTFDDVIARLSDIRRMGFDVLYFPPIHPIGRKNRKGRNNTLTPGPDDPGSPYAIGSDEGGHDAIHPELGTIDDFRRLLAAAQENGLEIALDFAIQCSPDHPWLRHHPDWFRWRADGSIKYAENPPKKYQDIVNVDFYGADAAGLWAALRDIVLYWAGEGVRIFRVDNPHTKPLAFWHWMIADVRARYPDVIFLSEAFTRPKMMYRLAKVGFSQSYTYFTWRNTKQEFAEYLTELTTTDVKEFFRPNFFVNTPDINPYFLQTSGRPGFLIRAALAATLSGLWGVYSGFELCEAAPLPGREEYLDSEKYEIRVRDQSAPGNIVAEISTLNRIRKAHPALQTHMGVKFYNAFNDQILLYGKMSLSGHDMILVAVNLDPHNTQEAAFELPLWEWKLPDHGSLLAEDLMRGHSFVWTGKLQRVRLDPADLPFAIWRIFPPRGVP